GHAAGDRPGARPAGTVAQLRAQSFRAHSRPGQRQAACPDDAQGNAALRPGTAVRHPVRVNAGLAAHGQFIRKLTGTEKVVPRPSGGAGNGEARRTMAVASWSRLATPVGRVSRTEVTRPAPSSANTTEALPSA